MTPPDSHREAAKRLTPDHDPITGEQLGRYEYRGYVIERERRSWSERNGNQPGSGAPLYSWNIYRESTYKHECDTLSEARGWINEASHAA